jgi:hypothetical protein
VSQLLVLPRALSARSELRRGAKFLGASLDLREQPREISTSTRSPHARWHPLARQPDVASEAEAAR